MSEAAEGRGKVRVPRRGRRPARRRRRRLPTPRPGRGAARLAVGGSRGARPGRRPGADPSRGGMDDVHRRTTRLPVRPGGERTGPGAVPARRVSPDGRPGASGRVVRASSSWSPQPPRICWLSRGWRPAAARAGPSATRAADGRTPRARRPTPWSRFGARTRIGSAAWCKRRLDQRPEVAGRRQIGPRSRYASTTRRSRGSPGSACSVCASTLSEHQQRSEQVPDDGVAEVEEPQVRLARTQGEGVVQMQVVVVEARRHRSPSSLAPHSATTGASARSRSASSAARCAGSSLGSAACAATREAR